jgi:hypothetical protein
VLLHDIWGILDSIACLLVGPGLLQDMGCENISKVMRPMCKRSFLRALTFCDDRAALRCQRRGVQAALA